MLRKLYMSALLTISAAGMAHAQCPAGRFNSTVFPSVDISTVTYSTLYSLQMDIYQPTGDTMMHRPLIILAHGGSFISGTRNDDSTVVQLCRNFARRGYVTASIDYRLGNIISMVSDSSYAIDVVIKAISDGKAAVRYFRQDANTTNTYKIDTNHIYYGGNSAGAVLYMHAAYLTDTSESAAYLDVALAANGGMEGNSGNAGYSSSAKAVINLAGALNSANFINGTDIPAVNAQGDNDNTVPYNCAYPLSGTVHVNLCGMGALESRFTSQGVYHMTKIFPGDAHVPWSTNAAKMYTVDSLVTEFLYTLTCPGNVGVANVATQAAEVTLYPNPATEVVNIVAGDMLKDATVTVQTGRIVLTTTLNSTRGEINTADLAPGVYFIRVNFAGNALAPITRKVVIE